MKWSLLPNNPINRKLTFLDLFQIANPDGDIPEDDSVKYCWRGLEVCKIQVDNGNFKITIRNSNNLRRWIPFDEPLTMLER